MSAEKTELERMLEGRQAVEFGKVQIGDVIVGGGVAVNANETDIGCCVGEMAQHGERVYRRIPVAKQGDLDAPPSTPEKARAKTDDSAKPPLAWLPWGGLEEVAWVLDFGAKKYGNGNYRQGMEVSRNLSCAIRHISAYMQGQRIDSESGRSHLAHAACRLLFALQNQKDKVCIEDVPER